MSTPILSADVAIAGCGIVGLASAERLTAAGLSVVLVDATGVANGPTGASGGLVRAFAPGNAWAPESFGVYLRRGPHGTWPEIRTHGGLTLFAADRSEAAVTGAKEVLAAGHPAEVLDAGEMHARFPGLTLPPDLVGVHEPCAGWLPAREVALAMWRDAEPRATILDSARATAVATSGDTVTGLHTTEGYVRARAVLLAAGSGSTRLAETVGVRLPLRTRAVSFCVFAPRTPDPGTLPATVDTMTGGWLRRWNTGDAGDAVLAGVVSSELDVPAEITAGVSAAERHRIRETIRARYPRLADAEVVGGVTAHDAIAPGGTGTVTRWPEPAGLVTATGWNGGGFKIAPTIGARAASLIQEVIA